MSAQQVNIATERFKIAAKGFLDKTKLNLMNCNQFYPCNHIPKVWGGGRRGRGRGGLPYEKVGYAHWKIKIKEIFAEYSSNNGKNKVTKKTLQHGNILNKDSMILWSYRNLSSQAEHVREN